MKQTSPAMATPIPGESFGRYQLLRELGDGGFGVVYEALLPGPLGFTKRVAIKMMHQHLVAREARLLHSMVNEARIGGLLHHSNIVDTNDFGQVDGRYYIAMEYVDGATLRKILNLCNRRCVLLPHFAVVDIALQVCRGLHFAHTFRDEAGPLRLVHCDLKPTNIIVDGQGTAKILDFGVARASTNLFPITQPDTLQGTPRYMSPEQITREEPVTSRSDIYTLGLVLYEMITGEPLFRARDKRSVMFQIVNDGPGDRLCLAEMVFPGSGRILRRALQHDPWERFGTASAMAAELRELGRVCPIPADMSEVMARIVPAVVDEPDETPPSARGGDRWVRAVSASRAARRGVVDATEWSHFTHAFDAPSLTGREAVVVPLCPVRSPERPGAASWEEAPDPSVSIEWPVRRPRWIGWLAALLGISLLVWIGITCGGCLSGPDDPDDPAPDDDAADDDSGDDDTGDDDTIEEGWDLSVVSVGRTPRWPRYSVSYDAFGPASWTGGEWPPAGSDVTWTAVVENVGVSPAPPFSVYWRLDGVPVQEDPATGLAPGERRLVAWTWAWEPTSHDLAIQIDANYAAQNLVNGETWYLPFSGIMNDLNTLALSDHSYLGLATTAGHRRGFFGEYLYDVPQEVSVEVVDTAGVPLAHTPIAVYQAVDNWIQDSAVMVGETDAGGELILDEREVAASYLTPTGHGLEPNPYGTISVVGSNGLLLIEAATPDGPLHGWLSLSQLNLVYWDGQTQWVTLQVAVE